MANPVHLQVMLDQKRKAVQQARKALEKAQKNLETVEAEFRGWEEALKAMTAAAGAGSNSSPPEPARRGLSEEWKKVIGDIAMSHPQDFSLAEIASTAEAYGIDAKPDTLRGQMHHYTTQRNFLERTSPGRFRATAEGAAAAGVLLGVRPNPSPEEEDDGIPF